MMKLRNILRRKRRSVRFHLYLLTCVVFADKKIDKIVLLDVNRRREITEGFIEANTRVIVLRTPLTSSDPIEIQYNPKQTGNTFDKHGGKVR